MSVFESVTDLFIPLAEPENTLAYPGPQQNFFAENQSAVERVITEVQSVDSTSFRVNVENAHFRVQRKVTPTGDYAILRKIEPLRSLDKVGFPSQIMEQILAPRLLKGGLILVCGQAGNGKSTSCAAIATARLKRFGGVCNTIEFPAEIPMTGLHGNGLMLQREVDTEEEFHEAIREALRCYPTKSSNILLVGEILDADIAASVLRSSVDGHLVITTIHAGDVIGGIHRLVSLAGQKMGREEARELLSEAFSMAVHQELRRRKGGNGLGLSVKALLDTEAVSNQIRNADKPIAMLNSEYKRQMTCLRQKIPIKVRGSGSKG